LSLPGSLPLECASAAKLEALGTAEAAARGPKLDAAPSDPARELANDAEDPGMLSFAEAPNTGAAREEEPPRELAPPAGGAIPDPPGGAVTPRDGMTGANIVMP